MSTNYPELVAHLQKLAAELRQGLPDTVSGYGKLHKAALADGALSTKIKELMALGIGIAIRCDGCIGFHTRGALKAGATREEILETIGVALLMGGGPSMVYGSQALEALNQFQNSEES